MPYWVKRILLKSGELVTEHELREHENRFDGPAPVVGDQVTLVCRGRQFDAKVIWGSWPGRTDIANTSAVVPIRVEELSSPDDSVAQGNPIGL